MPRNGKLVQVCRYARPADDARVVENLASGIPRIIQALQDAGLSRPTFYDTGLQFTAMLSAKPAEHAIPAQIRRRNATQQAVYTALLAGPQGVQEISHLPGIKLGTARKALRALV